MFKFKKVLISLGLAIAVISTNSLTIFAQENARLAIGSSTTTQQGYTLTWENANGSKVLTKLAKGIDTKSNIVCTYSNNNRITKTSGKNTVKYTYNNESKLISEVRGNNIFTYQYDCLNSMIGFTFNNIKFNFIKDSDFNVIAITDSYNNEIVKYNYDKNGIVSDVLGKDSMGNWIDMSNDNSFIGTLNLIRLHSYYYDVETNWYYNGYQYYDSTNSSYVGGTDNLNSILTLNKSNSMSPMVTQALVQQITTWRTSLMNTSTFGKSISYSSGWYNSLSDVEILSRLFYGENNMNSADQNAVAWVVINRYNANYGGGTYRGIATQSGQFEPITGASAGTANARIPNTSDPRWSSAVWSACTLLSTYSSQDYSDLIPKPTGISTQLFFVGLNYLLSSSSICKDAVPTGLNYSFNGGSTYVKMNNVVIVFDTSDTLQNPTSLSNITSNSRLNTYSLRSTHNIFFNY